MTSRESPAAKKTATKNLDALRDDLESLRHNLEPVMHDVNGTSSTAAAYVLDKGKNVINSAGGRLRYGRISVQPSVRKSPLKAVGAAFSAGLVLAVLSSR